MGDDNLRQPAAKREIFRRRRRLMAAVSDYFADSGAEAVETPILQEYPPPEPNVRGIKAGGLWLHASPESGMKKLLAVGRRDIFQFARVFRDDQPTPTHSREFTMLEWYRTVGGIPRLLADCRRILQLALEGSGSAAFVHGNIEVKPAENWEWKPVAELMAALGRKNGDFDALFHERVQPWLNSRRVPTVLTRWPRDGGEMLAAADGDVLRRVEVYLCGVELANGCEELADGGEARRRLSHWQPDGFDEALVTTADKMSGIAGMALGFDRLLMLSSGASHISEVQP